MSVRSNVSEWKKAYLITIVGVVNPLSDMLAARFGHEIIPKVHYVFGGCDSNQGSVYFIQCVKSV